MAKKQELGKLDLLNAIIKIVEETKQEPTIDQITKRITISRRTIFNYYPNKVNLFEDMYRLIVERIRSNFPQLDQVKNQSFETVLKRVLDERSVRLEYNTPFRNILEAKKTINPEMLECIRSNFRIDREDLSNLFSPFLGGFAEPDDAMRMILSALSWSNWNFLRTELDMGVEACRALVEKQVLAYYAAGKRKRRA